MAGELKVRACKCREVCRHEKVTGWAFPRCLVSSDGDYELLVKLQKEFRVER